MKLDETGRWWLGPNDERLRVIAGGQDVIEEPPVEEPPVEVPPAEPPTPTAEEEATRLREENARLRGENTALRETRREPPAPAPTPQPADAHVTEFQAIERDFAAGKMSEADRALRLGALGADIRLARREVEDRAAQVERRTTEARTKSGQRVAAYMRRLPALADTASPEFRHVSANLQAVLEEHPEYENAKDTRAQALALERTFGAIDRSPTVDTREFERRRHQGASGGGTFGEEPPPPAKPVSHGQMIFDKLLPEFQKFYLETRGSKEAAIKTLEHADEHQMRKQGRFR